MYNRIYKSFNGNNRIYLFQFGFREDYAVIHVVINLTGNIRKNLDEDKAGFGVFVDLK